MWAIIFIVFLLLIIVLLCWFFIWRSKTSDIDIVYTWVDSDDMILQQLKKTGQHVSSLAPFKSNNELKYSLRSVEKYAPWYRKIFIVIHDNQKPPWLLEKHPRLVLVTHSKIIPSQYLPTFNSLAIESFLHKIPGLSERFLYFNDDMILLKPVGPQDFFDSQGLPIESKCAPINSRMNPDDILMSRFSTEGPHIKCPLDDEPYKFELMLSFNHQILQKYFIQEQRYQVQHVPSGNRKSFHKELDRFIDRISLNDQNIVDATKRSKFRSNTNIARYSLFKKYWNMYQHGCREMVFEEEYIEINHLRSEEQRIKNIPNSEKMFLCVQNNIAYGDKGENIGQKDYALLQKVLEEIFPQSSCFEF